jgi:hypothetical protein
MIAQAPTQSRFSMIPDLIRTLTGEALPPSRDTVHLALEDLLILSVLCMFWGLVIVFCLEALR